MQRFEAPPKPDGFDGKVARAFATAKRAVAASKAHAAAHPDDRVKKVEFADLWGNFKAQLAAATRGKCGYCEVDVAAGQNGDVEHHSPKGAVWELLEDADQRGQDDEWTAKVLGRKRDVISNWGYWWRAYVWDNYLLSCLSCNQKWKLSYFPVRDEPRELPPSETTRETHLLLSPFHGKDPVKHLEFARDGRVLARNGSHSGQATIDVCGLNRRPLLRARRTNAKKAYDLVRRFLDEPDDSPAWNTALGDLFDLAHARNVHSGMVRAIFQHSTGLSWSVVAEIVVSVRLPALIAQFVGHPEDDPEREDAALDLFELEDADHPFAERVRDEFEAGSGEPWSSLVTLVEELRS